MAREYFSQGDEFPKLTVFVSAPDALAGSTWLVTLPLAGLTLDGRAAQAAIISGVLSASFGGAAVPEGVTCRLLANAHGADAGAEFDQLKTPLGSVAFELAFATGFAGMTDVPLTFTVISKAAGEPAIADVVLPTIVTAVADIVVTDMAGGAVSLSCEPVTCVCSPELTVISGQETIQDLAVGTATEITVDHSAEALFQTCEYPRIVAPVGVRVTVLASGIGADSTSEGQFVILVENVSYVTDGGYGTSSPDVTLDWTRTGTI